MAAAAACLVLACCGTAGPGAPPSDPGGSSMTEQPGPTDTGDLPVPPMQPSGKSTPTGGPGTPSGPGPQPARLTLTGTAAPGVEGGCLLLRGYLLLGGPRELLGAGRRVRVTGRVQPGVATTCQQGTPFLVESAEPA
jgi:hypothetical protein